jgi:hypothetical protein
MAVPSPATRRTATPGIALTSPHQFMAPSWGRRCEWAPRVSSIEFAWGLCLPAVFPDQFAPVVRATTLTPRAGPRPLGHAGPAAVRRPAGDEDPQRDEPGGSGNGCIVPAISFCEYTDTRPRKTPTWFALAEDRPLFAFALWTHRHRSKQTGPKIRGHFKANDQRHLWGLRTGDMLVRYGNWNLVFVRFTRGRVGGGVSV